MEAKQKAIENVYGKYFERISPYIDSDGWFSLDWEDNEMENIKKQFIQDITNCDKETSDGIDEVFEKTTNCYAKGYLYCKYEEYSSNTDDYEDIVEGLIECTEYDIWI
jgi:hypothetical protein